MTCWWCDLLVRLFTQQAWFFLSHRVISCSMMIAIKLIQMRTVALAPYEPCWSPGAVVGPSWTM